VHYFSNNVIQYAFVVTTITSFPLSCPITDLLTRATWKVPLIEQELLITPRNSSSPRSSGVRVVQSLVFFEVFCRQLFKFITFLGHCIVCPSSISSSNLYIHGIYFDSTYTHEEPCTHLTVYFLQHLHQWRTIYPNYCVHFTACTSMKNTQLT
jgi:hypothetical protein